ncbi:hypothetical protein DID88_004711 [Monilinia fructigena]|uniref:Uncharacterized protein n=1 Tax=Monilinia fructigena TaxID=38457 RepID=A0A395IRE6_9HELO|nr:hypothetical protein DID88_004711 [Monilinia fructigena]
MRKATFGQEETLENSNNHGDLPLKNISGNQVGPLVKEPRSQPQSSEPNPFQWSPKDAMQSRHNSASPNKIISKRKGHKRSNAVRMSGLSRPTSFSYASATLCVDLQSKYFYTIFEAGSRQVSLSSEVSPTPPPLKINPTFNIPSLKPVERHISSVKEEYPPTPPPSKVNPTFSVPPLKPIECHFSESSNSDEYSPTLSVCNYYVENINSEVDFFKHARSSLAMKSQVRRHCQNIDEGIISPDTPTETLVSFPPLPSFGSGIEVADLPEPPSRAKASSPLAIPSTSLPAPSLLSTPLPIPVHLTGPRPEPHKSTSYSTAMATLTSNTSSSTRDSIARSIGILRRMNSEISCISAGDTDSSPMVPGIDLDWGDRYRMSRASRIYLSIGSPIDSTAVPNHRSSLSMLYPNTYSAYSSSYFPQGNDSSTSVNSLGERRQSRSDLMNPNYGNLQEILEDINASREGSQGGSTRGSSPVAMGRHGLNVKEKKLSLTNLTILPDGGIGYIMDYEDEDDTIIEPLSLSRTDANVEKKTQTNKENKETRWSDAIIKPLTKTTRRESKMEYPSPKSPPKWGWAQAVNVAKERLNRSPTRDKENAVDGDWNMGRDSPESLGLYDQDGFLKNSPERIKAGEEKREGGRSATVNASSVDLMEEKRSERLSAHIVV